MPQGSTISWGQPWLGLCRWAPHPVLRTSQPPALAAAPRARVTGLGTAQEADRTWSKGQRAEASAGWAATEAAWREAVPRKLPLGCGNKDETRLRSSFLPVMGNALSVEQSHAKPCLGVEWHPQGLSLGPLPDFISVSPSHVGLKVLYKSHEKQKSPSSCSEGSSNPCESNHSGPAHLLSKPLPEMAFSVRQGPAVYPGRLPLAWASPWAWRQDEEGGPR